MEERFIAGQAGSRPWLCDLHPRELLLLLLGSKKKKEKKVQPKNSLPLSLILTCG
jgi:hypothetical protein